MVLLDHLGLEHTGLDVDVGLRKLQGGLQGGGAVAQGHELPAVPSCCSACQNQRRL